jgi:hydroxypyruvate reductase
MESRPEILLLTQLHPTAQRKLSEHFAVTDFTQCPPLDGRFKSARDRAAGIATLGNFRVDRELIAALPELKIISVFGAGYEGVDVDAAQQRNIVVANTSDALKADVADLAMALWISLARGIVAADKYVRAHRWMREGHMPLAATASGRSAGIVGFGQVGAAIAKRCQIMDMRVCYNSRRKHPEVTFEYYKDLELLAKAVDVLFVTCPGGDVTRGLVSATVLEALGPKGTLVNISRGSVVDERALVELLKAGRLGAAGLDVFQSEPKIAEELFSLDNVILTPHIGSATVETREAMANQVADNLLAYFSGRRVTNRIV